MPLDPVTISKKQNKDPRWFHLFGIFRHFSALFGTFRYFSAPKSGKLPKLGKLPKCPWTQWPSPKNRIKIRVDSIKFHRFLFDVPKRDITAHRTYGNLLFYIRFSALQSNWSEVCSQHRNRTHNSCSCISVCVCVWPLSMIQALGDPEPGQ